MTEAISTLPRSSKDTTLPPPTNVATVLSDLEDQFNQLCNAIEAVDMLAQSIHADGGNGHKQAGGLFAIHRELQRCESRMRNLLENATNAMGDR